MLPLLELVGWISAFPLTLNESPIATQQFLVVYVIVSRFTNMLNPALTDFDEKGRPHLPPGH